MTNSNSRIETVIEKQLGAYNRRDLEQFLECYAQEVQVFDFGQSVPRVDGINGLRALYQEIFEQSPNLHCKVVKRIQLGDTVIDEEKVTGLRGRDVNAIAIYRVHGDRIVQVHFIK